MCVCGFSPRLTGPKALVRLQADGHRRPMITVAINYNRRNTSYERATWVYNDMHACDTAVMISAQATPRLGLGCDVQPTPRDRWTARQRVAMHLSAVEGVA